MNPSSHLFIRGFKALGVSGSDTTLEPLDPPPLKKKSGQKPAFHHIDQTNLARSCFCLRPDSEAVAEGLGRHI
jgi:hypothetical protein